MPGRTGSVDIVDQFVADAPWSRSADYVDVYKTYGERVGAPAIEAQPAPSDPEQRPSRDGAGRRDQVSRGDQVTRGDQVSRGDQAADTKPAISAQGSTAETARGSQAALIVRLSRQAVGHGFRMGTEGPKYFDCSGLVWSVYKRAGLVGRVGGVRRGATGYLHWGQRHGRVTLHNPKVGDVILWGDHGRARHSGIYIGNGRVISALNPRLGVRNHPMRWIHMRIIGILHTGITR